MSRLRLAVVLGCLAHAHYAEAQTADVSALVRAYPDFLAGVEGNDLVWTDGTRMAIDDGAGAKTFEAWLEKPDIEDMLAIPYRAGRTGTPPPRNVDPGRARPAALFDKMYGNCLAGDVRTTFESVDWMPSKGGGRVLVSKVNGAADSLRKVVADLEKLPARFMAFLVPSAGTFNCRPIAGTKRLSAHGYGIAIDIATEHSNYWRWSKPEADGGYRYRNAIPWEIVEVFERHGWIWGGKWYHYDTMHFEYRPEMLGMTR